MYDVKCKLPFKCILMVECDAQPHIKKTLSGTGGICAQSDFSEPDLFRCNIDYGLLEIVMEVATTEIMPGIKGMKGCFINTQTGKKMKPNYQLQLTKEP